MNEAFRNYAFGRSFNLNLSEKQVETLSLLCKGDVIASYGFAGTQMHGLLRRGLVELIPQADQVRYRPTRAGVLIYDLLVEAGEYAALEQIRRDTLDREHELQTLEWNERFAAVTITLKDRHRRDQVEVASHG